MLADSIVHQRENDEGESENNADYCSICRALRKIFCGLMNPTFSSQLLTNTAQVQQPSKALSVEEP